MTYMGKHATLDALHSECEAKILPNPVYSLGESQSQTQTNSSVDRFQ